MTDPSPAEELFERYGKLNDVRFSLDAYIDPRTNRIVAYAVRVDWVSEHGLDVHLLCYHTTSESTAEDVVDELLAIQRRHRHANLTRTSRDLRPHATRDSGVRSARHR